MAFRWTPRRDRELVSAIEDLFTYREAANMIGHGCTDREARARMKVLRAAPVETCAIPQVEAAAPRPAVGGPVGGSMAKAAPRVLIELPRYGEMEKAYDPVTKRVLG